MWDRIDKVTLGSLRLNDHKETEKQTLWEMSVRVVYIEVVKNNEIMIYACFDAPSRQLYKVWFFLLVSLP